MTTAAIYRTDEVQDIVKFLRRRLEKSEEVTVTRHILFNAFEAEIRRTDCSLEDVVRPFILEMGLAYTRDADGHYHIKKEE